MAASAKAPCSSLARLRRTLGLLVWAGLVVIAPLNAQQSHPLLKLIDDHYNHLRSLRCRYVESYSGMGISRSESGILTLKKPGRMRWSYDKPSGKLFLLDGKFAWFYTPGDAIAQRVPAKQMDDLRTPLRLLLGHTQLSKELDRVTVTPNGPSHFRITGVPRGLEARVQRLTLDATPQGAITGMKLEELDGSTTEFTFSGMEEGVPVQDAEFMLKLPAGVSIAEGLPPM